MKIVNWLEYVLITAAVLRLTYKGMRMEMAKGSLGPEASYSVELVDGKFMIGSKYEGAMGGASIELHIGGHQVLDAIKKAIPGEIDDMVINVLEAALLPKA